MAFTETHADEIKPRSIDSAQPHFQNLFAILVQEINQRLVGGIAYEQILDFVFDALSFLIPFDRIGIALVKEDSDQVELKWVRSKIPIQYIHKGYRAPLSRSSLSQILETGQPRLINDLVQYAKDHPDSENTALIIQDGIRSSLTCALKADGRPVGLVFFSSVHTGTYQREHFETFSNIANELAIIVEHGRIHNRFNSVMTKDQFIRMMLHDLKSPLAIINGFLEEAASHDWYENLSIEGREICSLLHRNSSYMLELLNELSELLQLESSRNSLNARFVNLHEFLSEILMNARFLSAKKEIKIELEVDPTTPERFCFDPTLIRRVLENLLTNAIKFSVRKTKIQIRTWLQEEKLFCSVADQGPGIPKDDFPKLFQEFGKTSIRPTEGESSTGLGLAITKLIVEKHGGHISVESQFGAGSTFTFDVPDRSKPSTGPLLCE